MFLWILLFAFQQNFGAANNKTKTVSVIGDLCIQYCQPCITEQLGPYKEHCLKTFGIKHDPSYREEWLKELGLGREIDWRLKDTANILAHEPLHKLWIAVKAFSESSDHWAFFGHKKINHGSHIMGKAFPYYIPLVFFLDSKLNEDNPLFFELSLGNQKIRATLFLDQAEYKHQWGDYEDDDNEATFTTTKGMIIAILRRHRDNCKMQMWRLPPKEIIGTVIVKDENSKKVAVPKDEFILSRMFGYSPVPKQSSSDNDNTAESSDKGLRTTSSYGNLAAIALALNEE